MSAALGASAQLVLVFGANEILKIPEPLQDVRKVYPDAHLLGCSTAGEILDTQVSDNSLVTTAVQFEYTQINTAGSVSMQSAAAVFWLALLWRNLSLQKIWCMSLSSRME